MSPETFSAILGGLTDGVVGAVLGFLFAYLLFRLTQKRKLVEYSVSSISLFRLKPATDSVLTVSVNKEVFTGDPADHNEMLALNTVYGFQILLSVGNEDIEKIDDIEIRLDTAAKIVRCETEPTSTTGYNITTQKDPNHPNVLHLSAPYLSANTSMVIRLITTNNANSDYTVKVHGVGIKTRPARSRGVILNLGAITGLIILAMAAMTSFFETSAHHVPLFFNDLLEWSAVVLVFCGLGIFIFLWSLLLLNANRNSIKIGIGKCWKRQRNKTFWRSCFLSMAHCTFVFVYQNRLDRLC